jgi:DNA replication protein DnaC
MQPTRAGSCRLPERLVGGFTTAAALVHELIEARDEKRLLRLQRQLASYKLLIIDELG